MPQAQIKGSGTTGKWFAIRVTANDGMVWFDYVALGQGRVKEIRQHLIGVRYSRARSLAKWILDQTEG